MQFRKLFTDLKIRKGRGGYIFCEKEHFPEEMKEALPGYSKWCIVYNHQEIYVCAVPEKGGEYLVLEEILSRVAAIAEEEYA